MTAFGSAPDLEPGLAGSGLLTLDVVQGIGLCSLRARHSASPAFEGLGSRAKCPGGSGLWVTCCRCRARSRAGRWRGAGIRYPARAAPQAQRPGARNRRQWPPHAGPHYSLRTPHRIAAAAAAGAAFATQAARCGAGRCRSMWCGRCGRRQLAGAEVAPPTGAPHPPTALLVLQRPAGSPPSPPRHRRCHSPHLCSPAAVMRLGQAEARGVLRCLPWVP